MKLHEQEDVFKEIIETTATEFNLQNFQVEKDYYVSLLLKILKEEIPELVFKGGTSLSKCYNVINRFSEDIDVTMYMEEDFPSKSAKKRTSKKFNKKIQQVISETLSEFNISNMDEIGSDRDFNAYNVTYKPTFDSEESSYMVKHIIVETIMTYFPYPCEEKEVSSYIYKFLSSPENDEVELIRTYELEPFSMLIQSIDRTFIDKIFALCDYYENKKYDRYSRHIYDIHKIYKSDLLKKESLSSLVEQIILIRRNGINTTSSKSGYELKQKLQEIIDKQVFKADYETNTKEFLSEYEEYEIAINSLQEILKEKWLPDKVV